MLGMLDHHYRLAAAAERAATLQAVMRAARHRCPEPADARPTRPTRAAMPTAAPRLRVTRDAA